METTFKEYKKFIEEEGIEKGITVYRNPNGKTKKYYWFRTPFKRTIHEAAKEGQE